MSVGRWLLRSAAATAALVGLGVAVIGFAHTKAGHPLLRYLPGFGGGCPVGGDKLTAAEREAARQKSLGPFLGTDVPAARPALAFDLGHATRADVDAWAAAGHATCADEHGSLRCTAPAGEGISAEEHLLFAFDPTGRLVAVEAALSVTDPAVAASLLNTRASELTASAGPPTSQRGEMNADFLAKGAMSQASTSFRYDGYRAELAATNMGDGRFAVHETYQAL